MEAKNKVLIVDDEIVNQISLTKILSSDYAIIAAQDGQQALSILRKQYSEISAVLLDLFMPVMDGFQVLEAMMVSAELSAIPVIVVTQADKDDSEARALSLGARDFVSKPYNPVVLRRRLANLIELYQSNICMKRIEKDILTGLYNKDAFCRYALEMFVNDSEQRYILIATDIEHFKLINDSLGTIEGDKLLVYIAKHMQNGVQTVHGICSHLEADRFVALVPWMSEKRLRSLFINVEKMLKEYSQQVTISLKFGIYDVTNLKTPIELMCNRAVLAADSIKGQYNRCYAYYDDSMRKKMLEEQQIINEIDSALQNEEFEVYLQPKCSFATGRLSGAEALVRWNHPKKGLLTPGSFIPLFEKNGSITRLDYYMWEHTCAILRSWIDEFGEYVPISVNVSRADIYNINLPKILSNLVQKYNLGPEHLKLEITETAYTENAKQLIKVVTKLRKLGFQIEMDDFGSGYSSLNMLTALPIDTVKLDMGFIQTNIDNETNQSMLKTIISLSHELQLRVVAEGVETKEQAFTLKNFTCDYAQGYYFGKPMTVQQFNELLKENIRLTKLGKMLPTAIVEDTKTASLVDETELITIGYKTLLNNLPAGLHRCQMFGRRHVDYINSGFTEMTGYTMEDIHDLFNDHFNAMVIAKDRDIFNAAYDELSDKPGKHILEYHIRKKSGEIIRVIDHFRSVLLPNGQIWGFGIISDITKTRENYLRLKLLIDTIPGGFGTYAYSNGKATPLYMSDKLWKILGYTKEEFNYVTKGNILNILYKDDMPIMKGQFIELMKHDKNINCTCRILDKAGDYRWVNFRVAASERNGDSTIVNGVMFDVTTEKALEETHKELAKERKFQSIIDDSAPIGAVVLRLKDRELLHAGGTMLKELGYTYEELHQFNHNSLKGFIYEEDYKNYHNYFTGDLHPQIFEQEYRVVSKNGEIVWMYERGNLIQLDDEATYVIVCVNVTKQKEVEDQLRIQEEQMNYAMAQMGKMIFIYDIKSQTLLCPEQYANQHGFSKILHNVPAGLAEIKTLDQKSVKRFTDFYQAILQGDNRGSIETYFVLEDGTIRWERGEFLSILDANGEPAKAIISVEDVTELHKKQK